MNIVFWFLAGVAVAWIIWLPIRKMVDTMDGDIKKLEKDMNDLSRNIIKR
ncbi:MAG: hypothetical protein IIT53_12070 [Fibrobacter sp.]|nr:hypothetical protein [Fibrobacter sp.]